MSAVPERHLIWFRIVHTRADLGSLGGAFRDMYVRAHGERKWLDHEREVERSWAEIRSAVLALPLDFRQVRLYQDGLPECLSPGVREETIVRDLAAAGSANHQLLLDLVGRGASLTGTEAPDLLVEEYHRVRREWDATGRRGAGYRPTHQERAAEKSLLDRRDAHIAAVIGRTLRPGETGLLFLGALHSLDGRLPADVGLTRWDPTTAARDPGNPARSGGA